MPVHLPATGAWERALGLEKPKATRRKAGEAPGSWPRNAVCGICKQYIRTGQSYSFNPVHKFRHLTCIMQDERRQQDVADAHKDTMPA